MGMEPRRGASCVRSTVADRLGVIEIRVVTTETQIENKTVGVEVQLAVLQAHMEKAEAQ